MPTTTTRTDERLTRALAFERAMHAAVGRVVTTAWGQVYFETGLARCYERNTAWAVDDAAGLDAVALDREVDRLFGDAGLGHRRVVVEPPAAGRLAPGLRALGYAAEEHLYLAYAAPAPPPAPRAPVDEVAITLVADGNDRYLRTDPDIEFGRDATVRAHLVEHHRTYGVGARERAFAVRDEDGAAIAWAKLWQRDGVAQVEDVVCLAEHRGRGYGRDVVAAATRAALEDAPELLFIVADAADWPKELYGRLGYAPIGTKAVHTRHAPGFLWGAPTD
jgi:GNAT superfamily N-acetyltransferase